MISFISFMLDCMLLLLKILQFLMQQMLQHNPNKLETQELNIYFIRKFDIKPKYMLFYLNKKVKYKSVTILL